MDLTEAWPIGMSAEVVDATVRAVLQTAALSCGRGKGKAGHVDLQIEGAPEYSAAARTYADPDRLTCVMPSATWMP